MSGSIKDARLGLPERLLRGFAYCLVHTVQRPDVRGVKPPLDEPTIFACNHVGLMDPVVLMVEYYESRIVPVYNAMWHFPHRYRLAIGEPLRLGTPGHGKPQSEWLREQTEKIRSAIAALEEIVKI